MPPSTPAAGWRRQAARTAARAEREEEFHVRRLAPRSDSAAESKRFGEWVTGASRGQIVLLDLPRLTAGDMRPRIGST